MRLQGTAENDELLDALYPMLAAARVNLAADPQATAANLVKLFQVTQLVMELQHIYVSEDAAKIVEQQSEIQRLEAVSQAAVGGKRGIAGSSAGNPVALQGRDVLSGESGTRSTSRVVLMTDMTRHLTPHARGPPVGNGDCPAGAA